MRKICDQKQDIFMHEAENQIAPTHSPSKNVIKSIDDSVLSVKLLLNVGCFT